MKFNCLVPFMFMLTQVLSSCATGSVSGQKEGRQSNTSKDRKEIIYKEKNSNLIKIYNIEKSWFSTEGADYLNKRDFRYGEWGGQIGFCSNEDYYCIVGGVAVAIPKKINGQKKWQFKDMDCQSETAMSDQHSTTITCNYKQWSMQYVYSPVKGIISYRKLSDPVEEYELIGDKGLFAQTEEKSNAQME
jgi:hypothetical protein